LLTNEINVPVPDGDLNSVVIPMGFSILSGVDVANGEERDLGVWDLVIRFSFDSKTDSISWSS
jgi:hypothetical protein